MPNRVLSVFISSFFFLILIVPSARPRENSYAMYKEAAGLAEAGKIDEAIVKFRSIIDQSPFYALAHYGIGKAYLYKEGMLEDAIKHLKLSVTYDRNLAKGYFYLGHGLKLARRYEQAINSFKLAYRYDSTMLDCLYYIATIYEITGVKYKARVYYNNYRYEIEKKEGDILF